LETYFHNDPRIREWIDRITEKICTVCLLTGVDSDAEFESGCQIVMKIVSLLQDITTIPSEFLADGVKQLLEQQLPDTQVIDNFPEFEATMEKMIRTAILMIDGQNKLACDSLSSEGKMEEAGFKLNMELHDNYKGRYVEDANEEFVTESVIAALAAVNIPYPVIGDGEIETSMTITEFEGNSVETERLKRVLSYFFPNGNVNWNMTLMGETFLAQVDDILILHHDSEHPISMENFQKEGWKVFVCSSEDLTFSRRLERGLRQIQRSGKMVKTV